MDWECLTHILTGAATPVAALGTVAAAIATWYLYFLATRSLDYKKEVENLKKANLRVELSASLDARSAHEEWSDFPDPDNVEPSSHFYVSHNDRLIGTAFSRNLDDWCYRMVFLKKDKQDVDAYSDIILRVVGNQDDQKWVFYGHKVFAKLEWQSKEICSSPPYYQDFRIPVIHPLCTRVGVIRLKKEAKLTEPLDKVLKYNLFYRVRRAEVPIRGEEIPLADKLTKDL